MKLLWLEAVSGEPAPQAATLRTVAVQRRRSTDSFLTEAVAALEAQLPIIERENLKPVIIEVLQTPEILAALPRLLDLHRALHPRPPSRPA